MRLDELRQAAFARELAAVVDPELDCYEMADYMKDNTLGQLNIELFSELHRLREVDVTDADALRAEIERSKAVEGIAQTIVTNAKTVLDATRMRSELTRDASVPRMLEG
jgi:hypothetical protein